MKHLTTLLLTLLVLGGCASMEVIDPFQDMETKEWKVLNLAAMSGYSRDRVRLDGDDFIMNTYSSDGESGVSKVYYKIDNQNYTINLKAADRFNFGQGALNGIWYKYFSSSFCNMLLDTDIKGRPVIKEIDYRTAYTATNEVKFTCWKPGEKRKQLELAKLRINKSKCRDYGFKDETDGMGLCLIELDKLAKLEEQILAIEKRNNQVYLQNQQLIADQKRQREAQALINLGAAISGAGAPRTNTPKVPITTYPNSYSSSLTVPSNQVCPILSTPLTKQEIKHPNRICYYQ